MKPVDEITADIIDAAIHIHRQFGPGMYEKAYELLMQIELCARGHAQGSASSAFSACPTTTPPEPP